MWLHRPKDFLTRKQTYFCEAEVARILSKLTTAVHVIFTDLAHYNILYKDWEVCCITIFARVHVCLYMRAWVSVYACECSPLPFFNQFTDFVTNVIGKFYTLKFISTFECGLNPDKLLYTYAMDFLSFYVHLIRHNLVNISGGEKYFDTDCREYWKTLFMCSTGFPKVVDVVRQK